MENGMSKTPLKDMWAGGAGVKVVRGNLKNIHVILKFGRKHEPSDNCWCNPVQDNESPLVWVHRPEQ